MPKSILTIIVLFALPFAANARVAPSEADLLRHIEVLAADEMQGRAPGTRGEAMAAQYIASQFSAAGLEPGYNGHFYQPVALVERTPIEATGSWIGPEGRGQIGMDDIVSVGREPEIHIDSAPIYFAGTGLRIGAADGDPLAGLDLEGAVVLLMLQTEAERAANDAEPAVSRDERQAILREHGVAAVYLVPPNQELAQSIAGFFAAGRFGLASESGVPAEGVIGYELGQSLFAASNIDPAELAERTGQADAEAIRLSVRMSLDTTTDVRRFNGLNVVGRLSGVAETDETVAFMAHYDHLGLCRDESAEDRICNGAVDNASGTAALIETAAALADQGGHPRNLLFIATTAEERGLFGARAFVADPSVPLERLSRCSIWTRLLRHRRANRSELSAAV